MARIAQATCRAAAEEGAYHVRSGGGPFFLEFRTYRFRPHSMFDPELYRSKEEVEHAKERDPIRAFTERCVAAGALSEDDVADIPTDLNQFAVLGDRDFENDLVGLKINEGCILLYTFAPLVMPTGNGRIRDGLREVRDHNFDSHVIVLAQSVETVYPTLIDQSWISDAQW